METNTLEKICILKGDITKIQVDAIVNSAHHTLLAGSGVCGAIHKAAGKELEEECISILKGDIPVGQIPVTNAYRLPAKAVLHVVVPKAKHPGKLSPAEKDTLITCYREAIYTANRCGFKTVAFPSLGTGIRAYPVQEVAELAIKTLSEYLEHFVDEAFQKIYIVTHNDQDYHAYLNAYGRY